ncbi:MAG: GNAT family N-acetyltransferase [Clostridia bacterium]|nr:GNAT family N-acetyltransferase [Clostridia bacterium]
MKIEKKENIINKQIEPCILNNDIKFIVEDCSSWEIIDREGQSLGELCYSIYINKNEIRFAYIENIKVWEKDMGTGSKIIQKFILFAKKNKCEFVAGEVVSDDLNKAINFYQKNGFTVNFNNIKKQYILHKDI